MRPECGGDARARGFSDLVRNRVIGANGDEARLG